MTQWPRAHCLVKYVTRRTVYVVLLYVKYYGKLGIRFRDVTISTLRRDALRVTQNSHDLIERYKTVLLRVSLLEGHVLLNVSGVPPS